MHLSSSIIVPPLIEVSQHVSILISTWSLCLLGRRERAGESNRDCPRTSLPTRVNFRSFSRVVVSLLLSSFSSLVQTLLVHIWPRYMCMGVYMRILQPPLTLSQASLSARVGSISSECGFGHMNDRSSVGHWVIPPILRRVLQ